MTIDWELYHKYGKSGKNQKQQEQSKYFFIKKVIGEVFKDVPIFKKVPPEIQNICLVTTIPTGTANKETIRAINQIRNYASPDQIVAFYVQLNKRDKFRYEIYTYHF